LGGGLALGQVPSVSASVHLEVAWSHGLIWVGGRANVVVPGAMAFDVGTLRAMVAGAGPVFCVGTARWGGCSTLTLGATYAWPSDYDSPSAAGTAFTVQAGMGPYLDFSPVPQVKLRLFAHGIVQPIGAQLIVKGLEAWRTSLFAFTAGLAVHYAPVGPDGDS
jgi:hypothetical protein